MNNHAENAIRKASSMLELEAQKREGEWVFRSAAQLETVRGQLARMSEILATNQKASSWRPTFGRMVTDSWPLAHPLGESLIEAEQAFLLAMR